MRRGFAAAAAACPALRKRPSSPVQFGPASPSRVGLGGSASNWRGYSAGAHRLSQRHAARCAAASDLRPCLWCLPSSPLVRAAAGTNSYLHNRYRQGLVSASSRAASSHREPLQSLVLISHSSFSQTTRRRYRITADPCSSDRLSRMQSRVPTLARRPWATGSRRSSSSSSPLCQNSSPTSV